MTFVAKGVLDLLRRKSVPELIDTAAAEHQVVIAQGLIAMRKAGLFSAVHIDAGKIRVQPVGGHLRSIDGKEAQMLIDAFKSGELVQQIQGARAQDGHRRRGRKRREANG